MADELEDTKEKLEALHAVAGENSVLNDSNPEAEISILNDIMAAQDCRKEVENTENNVDFPKKILCSLDEENSPV